MDIARTAFRALHQFWNWPFAQFAVTQQFSRYRGIVLQNSAAFLQLGRI